ncbi:DUF3825 domain-containing protein [Pseudomonas siliginis]|uniref:DUF3825 domain-containing protein n=1 Tax=Pseudomonas siliginis TaxID=2842346 RepID=UPI002093CC21|nr:DUF3825 domain-containing protein [Pseudomonas siliginis]UST93235.1 DUF3825 domain-containing protein [Pseudomonas siliginis]
MPKNAPYDFPEHFRDFVFMPKFDENIEELASVVEKEDWEHRSTASSAYHPVLRNYLTYTYRRVAEEKRWQSLRMRSMRVSIWGLLPKGRSLCFPFSKK